MSKIHAYRLVKEKWINNAFTGDGAKAYGGRWNNKGKSCVYLAGSESLAILEIFVHIEDYSLLDSYKLLQINLPKSEICYLDSASLPQNWQDQPAPPETAELGDKWLKDCKNIALAVPSVVVPREFNYILNPSCSGFSDIISSAQELSLSFDPRLFK